MRTYNFIGHITTVSPVTIATPDLDGMPKNAQGNPYIPATSIRGFLRHIAHFAVASELEKIGKPLSVDDHYMLASGVDTGRRLKLGGGYETIGVNADIRSINPVISLFGNFTIGSLLKVGNAIPDASESVLVTVGRGARNHAFNRNNRLVTLVKQEELAYLQAIMKADSASSMDSAQLKKQRQVLIREHSKADKERKAEIFKEIEQIDVKLDQIKEERIGATETILRPIEGVEAIDAGFDLAHRMRLNNPSAMDLDFFLWVLSKASVDFRLGGHAQIGCGEVHAFWDVTESTFEDPTPRKICTIVINDNGFRVNGYDFDPNRVVKAIHEGQFDFTKYAHD